MSEAVPQCCQAGPDNLRCGEKAEWRIYERDTTAENRDDGYAESCNRHVGELLTHAGEPRPGKTPYYVVQPI